MANVIVSVDDKNLRRRLNRIERNISKNGMATVIQMARLIQARAARIAPVDTGRTLKFLKVVPINKEGVKLAEVGYQEGGKGIGNPYPNKTYSGGEFSLPLWMHTSNNAMSHPWRNGKQPKFLFIATNSVRKEFKDRIQSMIRKELKTTTK